MWIRPTPTTNPNAFTVVASNEFFELLQHQPSINNMFGVAGGPDHRYRVVLKTKKRHSVAMADTLEEANEHWIWIEQEVMSSIRRNNAADDESTIIEYLLIKFDGIAHVDEQERKQALTDDFNAMFGLEGEDLLHHEKCSMHRDGTTMSGVLYVSAAHVCFAEHDRRSRSRRGSGIITKTGGASGAVAPIVPVTHIAEAAESSNISPALPGGLPSGHVVTAAMKRRRKVAIEFCNVKAIEKYKTMLGAVDKSIQISLKDETVYLFTFHSGSARRRTLESIEMLWKDAMTNRLDRAQIALETIQRTPAKVRSSSPTTSPRSSSPPSTALAAVPPGLCGDDTEVPPPGSCDTASTPMDRLTVSQIQAFRRLNETFRLPGDEVHLFDHPASLWCGSSFKPGHLFVSRRFLSFVSSRYQRAIFLIIPFRIVSAFVKESGISGVRNTAIKIVVRNRKYLITAEHREKMISRLEDRRCRLALDMDLLPFIKVPEINTAGGEGFGAALLADRKHFSSNYLQNQHYLSQQWTEYTKKYGMGLGMMEDRDQIRQLLMAGGIPDKMRPSLWALFSGAYHMCLAQDSPNLYCELLQRHDGMTSAATDDIEKDLIRSFPEHPYFQTEAGIRSLRQVLSAYAWKNPKIGYCQSMNIVSALLLCYMPEHWTFFVLACICENMVPENYSSTMIGSIVDQSIFENLLKARIPRLASHMAELGVPIGVITHGWFLCLFIGCLPLELSLQTLDVFFFVGRTWLYSVGLAIFKLNETRILEADSPEDVIVLLKEVDVDGKDLLKLGFKYLDAIKADRLEELRNTERSKVIDGLEQNTREGFIRELEEDGTRFSRSELEAMFDRFLENIVSPETMRVSALKIHVVVQSILPFWEFRGELSDALFKTLDVEAVGSIDFNQFVRGMEKIAKGTVAERLNVVFVLHDEDGDGLLDKGDYYRLLDAVARSFFSSELDVYEGDVSAVVSDTFEEADKNEDGLVALGDVLPILVERPSEKGRLRRRLTASTGAASARRGSSHRAMFTTGPSCLEGESSGSSAGNIEAMSASSSVAGDGVGSSGDFVHFLRRLGDAVDVVVVEGET